MSRNVKDEISQPGISRYSLSASLIKILKISFGIWPSLPSSPGVDIQAKKCDAADLFFSVTPMEQIDVAYM